MPQRREFNRRLHKHRALRNFRFRGVIRGGTIIDKGDALPDIEMPNGTTIHPANLLGEGSGGAVFADPAYPHWAVKIMNRHDDHDDVRAIRKLGAINCGQIQGVAVGTTSRGEDVVVLERMQYDTRKDRVRLIDAIKEMEKCNDIEACVHVAEIIRQQLICLIRQGLYYLDLKSENVMFNLDNDRLVKLALVDLGSIGDDGMNMNKAMMTYPDCDTKMQCVAYQLGMFLAELLGRRTFMGNGREMRDLAIEELTKANVATDLLTAKSDDESWLALSTRISLNV